MLSGLKNFQVHKRTKIRFFQQKKKKKEENISWERKAMAHSLIKNKFHKIPMKIDQVIRVHN